MIDWDKPIDVIDWKRRKYRTTVPLVLGLQLMSISVRYDSEHLTSVVRILQTSSDLLVNSVLGAARGYNLPIGKPILFCQGWPDKS